MRLKHGMASMRLGHGFFHTPMRYARCACAPCIWKCGEQASFPTFILGKARTLAQTQVETLTINTNLPHSEFLVQNCGCSRGRKLWSFRRVSIFSFIF